MTTNSEPYGCTHKVDPGKECKICAAYADRLEYRRGLDLPKRLSDGDRPTVTIFVPDGYADTAEFLKDCQFEPAHMPPVVLVKRPVAFRILRADADTAGTSLSETDWRYFSNEEDAISASDALGTEYHGLYARDGTAVAVEFEELRNAIINTLKSSAPGLSEITRGAILTSVLIKLRHQNAAGNSAA